MWSEPYLNVWRLNDPQTRNSFEFTREIRNQKKHRSPRRFRFVCSTVALLQGFTHCPQRHLGMLPEGLMPIWKQKERQACSRTTPAPGATLIPKQLG
jgi:hypothetical protein